MGWLQVIRILILICDSLVLLDRWEKGLLDEAMKKGSQLGLQVGQIWFRISVPNRPPSD